MARYLRRLIIRKQKLMLKKFNQEHCHIEES